MEASTQYSLIKLIISYNLLFLHCSHSLWVVTPSCSIRNLSAFLYSLFPSSLFPSVLTRSIWFYPIIFFWICPFLPITIATTKVSLLKKKNNKVSLLLVGLLQQSFCLLSFSFLFLLGFLLLSELSLNLLVWFPRPYRKCLLLISSAYSIVTIPLYPTP